MRKLFTIALVVFFGTSVFAQEIPDSLKKWNQGGVFGLNFNQISLTNWAAGGENSIAGQALFSGFVKYDDGDNTWDNNLDLGYGLVQQGFGEIGQLRKSHDKLNFASKYGNHAINKWYYSALLDFKSQFTPGYNYPNDSVRISNFLAPAYLIGAIGMDYKPNKNFSLFISPFTSKNTFVMDDVLSAQGAFGVDSGSVFRTELGGFIKAAYTKDIMKNLKLGTKLDLFSNYLNNPQFIDVNWEVLLAAQITKYIQASITTNLIYDKDILIPDYDDNGDPTGTSSDKVQFKEIFAIGFTYKL